MPKGAILKIMCQKLSYFVFVVNMKVFFTWGSFPFNF